MPNTFSTRVIAYTPGGGLIADSPMRPVEVPYSGGSVTIAASDIPTITLPVTEAEYGTMPEYLELALQVHNGTDWVEPQNCRFFINNDGVDKDDPSGTFNLQGTGLWPWFLKKTYLDFVNAYTATVDSVGEATLSSVRGDDQWFVKNSHGLSNGDTVQITTMSTAKNFSKKVTYWVRDAEANRFKLSGSKNGASKHPGTTTASIDMLVLGDRLQKTGHKFVKAQKVTVTATGGADGITKGSDYYIVEPRTNSFGLSSSVGGKAILVGVVNNMVVSRAFDGDRRFNARTPGYMLSVLIDEAQLRGELLGEKGEFKLTYDFTDTLDSDGNPWPKTFYWGVPPMMNGLAFLQALADKGWISYGFQGRTLRAWPAGRGFDRTISAAPIIIGENSVSRPVRRSKDNLLTTIKSVSDSGRQVQEFTTAFSPTPLGYLALAETQSSISDPGTSADLVDHRSQLSSIPDEQFSVTESAFVSESRPLIDYFPGDKVLARRDGVLSGYVVSEMQLRFEDADVQVDVTLGHRFQPLIAKLAGASTRQSGGVSVGGSGLIVPVVNASVPAAPTNIVVASSAQWSGTSAVASLATTFDPVETDVDGAPISVKGYEVYARSEVQDNPVLISSTEQAVDSAGALDPALTYYVSARVLSVDDQWGVLSDEVEVSAATPEVKITQPTNPVVTTAATIVSAKWDGLIVDVQGASVTPPAFFSHVYAEWATSSGGTYTPGSQQISQAGPLAITGLTVGATYFVRLRAVDTAGNVSAPTDSSLIVVGGISLANLASDASGAISAAQASANGKNKIVYDTAAPSSVTGFIAGDTWFRKDSSNRVIGQWELIAGSPNAWVAKTIDSLLIANIDAAKITTGTLAGITISGVTITGSTIRTSASGSGIPRVEQNQYGLTGYDAAGNVTMNFATLGILTATDARLSGTTDAGIVNAATRVSVGANPPTVGTGTQTTINNALVSVDTKTNNVITATGSITPGTLTASKRVSGVTRTSTYEVHRMVLAPDPAGVDVAANRFTMQGDIYRLGSTYQDGDFTLLGDATLTAAVSTRRPITFLNDAGGVSAGTIAGTGSSGSGTLTLEITAPKILVTGPMQQGADDYWKSFSTASIAYATNWTASGVWPGRVKSRPAEVLLNGTANRTTGSISAGGSSPVLTLPVALRPATNQYFPLVSQSETCIGMITIATTGAVTINVGTGSVAVTSVRLDHIRYSLD